MHTQKNSTHQKPTILVSLAPYQFLTERIAGDEFHVSTVIPLEENPHAYEPTIGQIQEIAKGTLWLRIGESFEQKVLPMLQEQNTQLTDVDLCQGLHLLQHGSHHAHCKCSSSLEDRHTWLSPTVVILQIDLITKALSEKFPQHSELFFENAKTLVQEFERLDEEIAKILLSASQKSFVVSHPAFAYFCERYHVHQISIEFEGRDPTPKYLTKIMEEILSSEVKLGIAMPQHSNKGLEVISEKLHLHLQTIDPYAKDCMETMRHLAHVIAHPEYNK